MFLGLQFAGDKNSFSSTCPDVKDITIVQITNGIYDDLFGTNNKNIKHIDSSKKWDFETRFYAKFRNNLSAGNVDYSAENVSNIRIKRMKNNEQKWLTLWDLPIKSNNDFSFELFDRYAQAKQNYHYSVVPVTGGIEGNINSNDIYSEFNYYFICDKEIIYPIIFNTSLDMELNKPIGVVNTLGSKYPFVITNSKSQYKSGTLQFSLIPIVNCEMDFKTAYLYRQEFEEWIMNGSSKILKDWTGQIFLINITSNISIGFDEYDLPKYEMSFTEVGNACDMEDLYNNYLIDANPYLSNTISMFWR